MTWFRIFAIIFFICGIIDETTSLTITAVTNNQANFNGGIQSKLVPKSLPNNPPYLLRIPPVNFYKSTSNAVIVVSKCYKFLRDVSAALGTPYVIFDWAIPILWLGVALIFVPDFTQLHQFPFSPNGAGPENDPLAAFPPFKYMLK